MKLKALLRTKTFWTGIGTIASGIVMLVNGDTLAGVQTIAGGVAMITVRDALVK